VEKDETPRKERLSVAVIARAAKQFRRRLEWSYKRTGKASNKVAYKAAVEAAHFSIMKSCADAISGEVDKAKGDQPSKANVQPSATQQAVYVLQR